MARHIAFLRAINVGGRFVTMERLREIFESLRLASVETFIASGNVIFASQGKDREALQARIEHGLEAQLGYAVACFLRSPAELAAVDAHCRQSPTLRDAPTLNVAFLKAPLSAGAALKLRGLASDLDAFETLGREVYWRCHVKQSESKFSNALFERTLGLQATFRGANTVARLSAKVPAGS